jgi:SAM-dependent methyltransferase
MHRDNFEKATTKLRDVLAGTARCVNWFLHPLGVRLVRRRQMGPENRNADSDVNPSHPADCGPGSLPAADVIPFEHVKGFLPAEPLIRAAEESGLQLEDYLDQTWKCKDHREEVIQRIANLGVFDQPLERVVEIGAGTGLFTEVVLRRYTPSVYESYEPDADWSARLARDYSNLIAQPADGMSLSATASESADLVIAHRVFVYLAPLTALLYFQEMARVLRTGGHAVFDVISEDCLDGPEVDLHVQHGNWWLVLMPKDYLISHFSNAGFECVGEFLRPLMPRYAYYKTRYLIFRKT